MATPHADTTLVGTSTVADALRSEIHFAARADAKVLVTGETGVGKDLVARLIHQSSRRRLAPMATINCAGLPETLLESELFGHVRGSFTDAVRDKAGIFESAANGTVFLDEVGEMSARMQAVLLRFLETGELQRVGADRVHARVNVRVIAATNRDLTEEIRTGRFREDLFYRLNVLHIHVAPLRERPGDVAELLQHFLREFSLRHGAGARVFDADVLQRLSACEWPGNVRQLKNLVERVVVKSSEPVIRMHDLPRDFDVPRQAPETAPTEREHPMATQLMSRMLEGGESFWRVVHGPFMDRDITRANLTEVISRGLERSGGNYRGLVSLFNMPQSDYKRFLTFLTSHRCHVRFQAFRSLRAPVTRAPASAPATVNPVRPIGVGRRDARPPQVVGF